MAEVKEKNILKLSKYAKPSVKEAGEITAWLKFANLSWLGSTIRSELIKEFKTPDNIFMASREKLARVKGWNMQKLARFISEGSATPPICSPDLLEEKQIEMICFNDIKYPPLLREIPDAPPILFLKGDISAPSAPTIAIVGARNGTQMGYDIARDFSYCLAKAGFTVVSGLALGIDTYAHRGVLEADGTTIAVLANGLDVIYPKGNRRIRDSIIQKGAIMSEYPPGTIPRPWFFPIRNRIISGMSIATLVVEASARSGSLITARLAAEQNREVFAIPSTNGNKASDGTVSLIQDGAIMVTEPKEIIEYFSSLLPDRKEKLKNDEDYGDLTDEEKKLLVAMTKEPVSIDKLFESGWPRERLFSLLLQLEMRDYLTKLPGNKYQTRKRVTIKVSNEQH